MSADAHLQAVTGYRDASDVVRRATAEPTLELRPDAVETLTGQSLRLSERTALGLASDSSDVRQLAALQLQAQAALDIDLANRIVGQVNAPGEGLLAFDTAETLSDSDIKTLHDVLATPQGRGISSLLEARHALLADVADSPTPDALKAVVDGVFTQVTDAAGKGATAVLKDVLAMPGDALLKSADRALDDIFQHIHDGERLHLLIKKAVRLVVHAIESVLKVFGVNTAKVRELITGWFSNLSADQVAAMLRHLYHAEEEKQLLHARIDAGGSTAPPQGLQRGIDDLNHITSSFDKQMWVEGKLAWLLGKAQPWLIKAQPEWGPIGLAAGYVAALSYTVFAAGDYLDWSHKQLLDLFDGVEHVVDRALDPQAAHAS